MTRIPLLEVQQPIGIFYLGVLPAKTIFSISEVKVRKFDANKGISLGGVQRENSQPRIKEISEYCSDPDATFPTSIIIAVNSDARYQFDGQYIEFEDGDILGEIIDGQHRIKGLSASKNIDKFNLPVVFMFDLTEEEKAYVFSIINSKQTKVPMSLIYDLFELSEKRSPQKICHEIARLLNTDNQSPFYARLKMLGPKESNYASLSQGSFIRYLLPLITKNAMKDLLDIKANRELERDPSLPLRDYFIDKNDEVIYKIILNLFSGVRDVFLNEWNDSERFILSKTMGYGAILSAFPQIYQEGQNRKDLTREYFKVQFTKFESYLRNRNLDLTSAHFPSNQQMQSKLGKLILESMQLLPPVREG